MAKKKSNIVHVHADEWSKGTGKQSAAALARRGYLRNVHPIQWARPGLNAAPKVNAR